jgi:hypothetical protein
MDDRTALRDEFSKLLRRAAELKVSLDRMDGKIQGVPHYSLIEETAHELGREVSRMVQVMHFQAMIEECPQHGACPDCGKDVPFERRSRTVLSGDGPRRRIQSRSRCRRNWFVQLDCPPNRMSGW